MRSRRIAAVVAALGLVAAAPAAAPASPHNGPVAHAACSQATIGGQSKCIARGQFCARRYQRDYLRYGLSCSKLDSRGNWHLS
jgi:hypothetical protein